MLSYIRVKVLMYKEVVLMVSIIFQDGAFKVKGTWDFGIAGVFENKEYGEGNIEVGYSFDDLCRCLELYIQGVIFVNGRCRKKRRGICKSSDRFLQ